MFLGDVFWRSANESPVGDEEALANSESSDAASPAPEQAQGTPDTEDAKAVPYPRFKEVNDKLAGTLAELDALRGPETPAKKQESVSAAEIKAMMKDALKDLGLGAIAQQAKQLQIAQKKQEVLGRLREIKGFDEGRDVPLITAKMQKMKANGETISAVNAFKLLMAEGPPKRTPVAHDAVGTTTGADQEQNRQRANPNMSPNQQRELEAKASFKQMLERDPAFRKALELD